MARRDSRDRRLLLGDPRILPHVHQALDVVGHGGDAEDIATYLRSTYPLYKRKPKQEFVWSIERALQICRRKATDSEPEKGSKRPREEKPAEEGREDSDLELPEGVDLVEVPDRNALNARLVRMYGGGSVPQADLERSPTETTPVGAPGTVPESLQRPKEDKVSRKKARSSMTPRHTRTRSTILGDEETRLAPVSRPTTSYADLGGIESCLQDVRELIEYPLTHPEIYAHLGVDPPRGILLHGPPGCGKTLLANAIAGELDVPFYRISAPEIVSGMSGESEAKIRKLFDEARANAPCIVFIDEIDAITPKRETAQREMERRIVAQLLTCMDDLASHVPVIMIGATNRPEALDNALRRAGRFDREIPLGIPDEAARGRILQVLARKLRLAGDFDFVALAKKTPGFVGADLSALTREAAIVSVNRIFRIVLGATPGEPLAPPSDNETTSGTSLADRASIGNRLRAHTAPLSPNQLEALFITMDDFHEALKKVQPSSTREGFATIPDVSWSDIGALDHIREELEISVLEPIRHPEMFEAIGLTVSLGVLLYGPPGCGKTLLAKAIANESHANFISIKGPELLNKYVGESERGVRQVFQRARNSCPCVVFFDELDSLCPRRGNEGNPATERVVNQLLTEMDGLDNRGQVFVIAATNRPDIIDPAMLRPGRLDKLLYVPLPTRVDRISILKTHTGKVPTDPDVNWSDVALDSRCDGFSGADLAALVRECAVSALRDTMKSKEGGIPCVCRRNVDEAFTKVIPSVSKADEQLYLRMSMTLRKARSHLTKDGDKDASRPSVT